MQEVLGLGITVPDLDTDCSGTFTGDIPRIGTMREAAERKARAAIEASGLPLGLASEGSFGPHPSLPFVAAATELLVFVDVERDLVVTEKLVTLSTNFTHAIVASAAGVGAFLQRCGFPQHALVVRPNLPADGTHQTYKGIRLQADLMAALQTCIRSSLDGHARLETDMRAYFNPTRMGTLQPLAVQLATRLSVKCPACKVPGFGVIGRRGGLPCRDCGCPTDVPVADVKGCARCTYVEEVTAPYVGNLADPKWCAVCNP